MKNNVNLVKNNRLFGGLSEMAILEIIHMSTHSNFSEGETIYDLGDKVDNCYIIISGRVRFSLGHGDKVSNTGAIVKKSELFGWAAILEQQSRRIAKATCLEDVEAISIDGAKLRKFFDSDHDAGYLVYKQLATLIMHDFISFAAG